jgi:hypothetical protein
MRSKVVYALRDMVIFAYTVCVNCLPLGLDWTWIHVFHHMMYTTPYMKGYCVDVCKTSNIVNIW